MQLPRAFKRQNFGQSAKGLTQLAAEPSIEYLKKMFPTFDDKMLRDTLDELKNAASNDKLGDNQNLSEVLERSPQNKIMEQQSQREILHQKVVMAQRSNYDH